MNNIINRHIWISALKSVRYAVGAVVLPSNNGPIFAADTRNPLYASGVIRIQGCD